MRQVRIALGAMPEELRHLVELGLADQPDLDLVAAVTGEVALLLEAARADVVVVAMRRDRVPAVAERLLDEYPDVGVVCLDLAGRRGLVYRLRPELLAVSDVSPRGIAAAIRSAADSTAA